MGRHAQEALDLLEQWIRRRDLPIEVPGVSLAALRAVATDFDSLREDFDEAIRFPLGTPDRNAIQVFAERVIWALLLDLAEDASGPPILLDPDTRDPET